MTEDRSSPDGSSTSPTTPTPGSPPFPPAPSTSASSGSRRGGLLTPSSLRALASRHGVRPRRSLGQHFLADPNLARAIVREAGIDPGDRVLEIGAGLGSLTLALVEAGAEVVAIELDRALIGALGEAVPAERVRIERADAVTVAWGPLLGDDDWMMVSNLPYNVAVPVVIRLLEEAPRVDPIVVMVQREVGERLAAAPGEEAFGAVSLRVAYRARASVVRRIPPSVFWPRPGVESVLVRLERRPPPVATPQSDLFRLIDEGFAQRRKTMANALVRLGLDRAAAASAMERAGLDPRTRAEELGLEEFARLAEEL